MKKVIVSFHNGNLNPRVLELQRQVFEHYGIPLQQYESSLPHGEAMDEFCQSTDWDVGAFFDIDAFCRSPEWLLQAMGTIYRNSEMGLTPEMVGTIPIICGGAHNANHLPGSRDYASPACCVVPRRLWLSTMEKYGKGFQTHPEGRSFTDAGQLLSIRARELGYNVSLLYPERVREPKWKLNGVPGAVFGRGTDYGMLYHEFESRVNDDATLSAWESQCLKELSTTGCPEKLKLTECP